VAEDQSDKFNFAKEFEALNASMRSGYSFLKSDLNDTTLVMTATSLIDQFLRYLLIIGFRPDVVSKRMLETVFEGSGPLASFSARTHVCTALGLITGEVRHDLTILRDIRNKFAHSPQERRLAEFPACLSLRMTSSLTIEDEPLERRKFKISCAGIIPHLSISALVHIAKLNFLARHKEEVTQDCNEIIAALYRGETPS
jgi:DNA-binding MltR family transcriptional regulator